MKFRPILKQVLWGGSKICSYKNLDVQESKVGESWEISDVKGSVSVVAEGALAGMNIDDLLEKYQELLLEKNYQRFGNEFPCWLNLLMLSRTYLCKFIRMMRWLVRSINLMERQSGGIY